MRRALFLSVTPVALALLSAAAGGCGGEIVGTGGSTHGTSSHGGAPTTSPTAGSGGMTTSTTSTTNSTGTTSSTTGTSSSSSTGNTGGAGGAPIVCGAAELCDPARLGFDDDCNGTVDEGCACIPGQAHFCFKGDPSYRGTPGCFDGTQKCTAQGAWGPCVGGVHATAPDQCFLDHSSGPHAITTSPFRSIDLRTGLGDFDSNALPGTESWTVTCPSGVSPCPGVTLLSNYRPIQSGEYTVHYVKSVMGGGMASADYPLIVRARGLRVELTWEHTPSDTGVDLDLHLHQPDNSMPWGISPAVPQDCSWANCTQNDLMPPQSFGTPHWFADPPAQPPAAVNWYLDPVTEENNCFYTPSTGGDWQAAGLGCHSPRLDLDNISCDAHITDPDDTSFCMPENINVDFPPQGSWFRVGVHYYNNHGLAYDVHPYIRIFCDGSLAAELGPEGYYVPEAPVTFTPDDGAGLSGNRFWMVTDVAYAKGPHGSYCTAIPLYSDAANRTPYFSNDNAALASFGPPSPPPPPP